MADVFGRLKAAIADRYTIERELGAGGMATVYLAQDLKHRRRGPEWESLRDYEPYQALMRPERLGS